MISPALPLLYPPVLSAQSFLVSDANHLAFHAASQGTSLYLWGPPGSGKTHLAALWRQTHPRTWVRSPLALDLDAIFHDPAPTVVEDLPPDPTSAQEETLFHLYNLLHRHGYPLLVTARFPLTTWGACLPDLTTRLSTLPSFSLDNPDDDLLLGILLKRFSDLGLFVEERALSFLLKHIPRRYDDLHLWVDRLHRATLGSSQSITIPLIKKFLPADSYSPRRERLTTLPKDGA